VQNQERNEERQGSYSKEQAAGDPGRMPGLRHKTFPHRQGLNRKAAKAAVLTLFRNASGSVLSAGGLIKNAS